MKKLTLLLLAIVAFACDNPDLLLDQGPEIVTKALVDENNENIANSDIFMVVEEQASFPGGMGEWSKFLRKTLKYPEQAKKLGIEGAVFLSFIVHEDGSLDDIQVARGIGGGCDEEAVMALLESPKWIAGRQGGVAVKSRMQLRIAFRLSEGNTLPNPTSALTEQINKKVSEDGVMLVVDQVPEFPGGRGEWAKYLKNTLQYPEQAKKMGIEGAVFLSFIVNEDGSLEDIQVAKGIGAGCDAEALRALKESPNWIAAKHDGKIVKSRMQVRVVFRLD